MIMSVPISYNFITYKTLEWFTLTLITTPTPRLIFTNITFGTNQFYSIEKLYKSYYFKIWHIKMNQQDYTGYIQSTSEQAESHGQVQSGSERAQFGSGQVRSGSEKSSI